MEKTPKTQRSKRKRSKNAISAVIFIIVNIIVVIVVAVSVYKIYDYFFNIGFSVVRDEGSDNVYEEVNIVIPEGSSTEAIANILAENGLIKNPFAFRLKCKIQGVSGSFYAGSYTLNTRMGFNEIVGKLQTIAVDDGEDIIKFMAPEGATVAAIAAKLETEGIVSAKDFIDAANNIEFAYSFIEQIPERPSRLEGYLFPDTYFLKEGMTSEEIINKMLGRTEEIYESYKEAADARGLSMDEVMTIASIIEGEVRYPYEREVVASVIYNRLDIDMKLQMDSTVLYAMGEYKERLYASDTEIQSPYNTYYVNGLPAGPIGNPGEACIKAAINPIESDYLYYVLEEPDTGKHYFTNNYNDFLNAKQRYLNTIH